MAGNPEMHSTYLKRIFPPCPAKRCTGRFAGIGAESSPRYRLTSGSYMKFFDTLE